MDYKLPPLIIYKYTDPETANKILITNTLMFSNPLDFNDPFDCHHAMVDWKLTEEGIVKTVNRAFSKLNRQERRNKIQELSRNKNIAIATYKDAYEKTKGDMGICCFSKNCDNLLLWSHYTDKHKGICIGFSLKPATEYYFIREVEYPIKMVKKNFFTDENVETLKYLVLTKSHYWEYEEEVRAVALNYKGLVDIHPGGVKKIIFGYKSDDSFIQEIHNIVRKNYSHIDIYTKMELDADNFGLKESDPKKLKV